METFLVLTGLTRARAGRALPVPAVAGRGLDRGPRRPRLSRHPRFGTAPAIPYGAAQDPPGDAARRAAGGGLSRSLEVHDEFTGSHSLCGCRGRRRGARPRNARPRGAGPRGERLGRRRRWRRQRPGHAVQTRARRRDQVEGHGLRRPDGHRDLGRVRLGRAAQRAAGVARRRHPGPLLGRGRRRTTCGSPASTSRSRAGSASSPRRPSSRRGRGTRRVRRRRTPRRSPPRPSPRSARAAAGPPACLRGRGPGGRPRRGQAVIGLVLAGVAAAAVSFRGTRRRRRTD